MRPTRKLMDVRPHLLRDERGTTLLEVIVAAVVLVIIAGSITSMVVAAQTGSGQQRVQAIAADLGQSTLEELRARKFANLSDLDATTTVVAGGVEYTVRSRSEWAMQSSPGATDCDANANDPTALKLSTTVTWPKMQRSPVEIDTLIAAPVGAASSRGNVIVQIVDAQGVGVPGVSVTVGTLTRATDGNGCVRFSGVSEGRYTLTFSKAGYVTPQLASVHSEEIDVVAGQTRTVSKEYDVAGTGRIQFVTSTPVTPAGMPSATFKAAGMADVLFTAAPAGTHVVQVDRSGMYPAAGGYQAYADTCAAGFPGAAAVVVPSGGGLSPRVDVQVPIVRLDLRQIPNGAVLDVKAVSACGNPFTLPPTAMSGNVSLSLAVPAGIVQSLCFHYVLGGADYRFEWTDAGSRTIDQATEILSARARTNEMTVGTCP